MKARAAVSEVRNSLLVSCFIFQKLKLLIWTFRSSPSTVLEMKLRFGTGMLVLSASEWARKEAAMICDEKRERIESMDFRQLKGTLIFRFTV